MKKNKKLQVAKSIEKFALNYFEYMSELYSQIDVDIFKQFEKQFDELLKKNKTLFIIGNGGSATTSTSMANDLGFDILKKTKIKKTFKMMSLTDNISALTAISNDLSFNEVFTSQLKIYFEKGDKILIFSASGNSTNVINAANLVKKKGGKVMSVVGFDGGKLKKISDICLHIPSNKGEYGPVEDLQLTFNHILAHWYQLKLNKA